MNTLSNSAPWNNSKHGDTTTFQALANAKFGQHVTVDGFYGTASKTACQNIQHFFGLNADGICGPNTWAIVLHMPIPA